MMRIVQNKIFASLKVHIQKVLRKDVLPGVLIGLLLSLGLVWPLVSSGLHFHPLLVFIYQVGLKSSLSSCPKTHYSCYLAHVGQHDPCLVATVNGYWLFGPTG